MHVRLWHSPYNGGWIWFNAANIGRCSIGRHGHKFWGAVFGLSWSIILQTWPWQKSPRTVPPTERTQG